MSRTNKKKKIDAIKRYLKFLVEEIDEYYFEEDENSKILKSFSSNKKSMNHFLIDGKAVILYYYDKSQKTNLIDDINNYFQDNCLAKKVIKIQIIFIVDSMNEKKELFNYLKENKKTIIKGLCHASNFKYNVIFIPKVDKKPIELYVSRLNSILFPEPNVNINIMPSKEDDKSDEIAGYIFIVSLVDLVDIYNRVGDELFASNLRYGIEDKMSLENSMKYTLLEEPNMFWYYNNGITIVTEQDDIDIEDVGKVVLSDSWEKQELGFSVINGAQTISTVSKIFADNMIPRDKIEKAKKEAKVLLRIITAKSNSTRRNITIALNRQKPIRPEDIAFQSDFVTAFNEYMSERESSNKNYLYIIKRGENAFDNNTIELPLFAQLVYACFMNPTDARNNGPSKLYSVDGNYGKLTADYFREEFVEANTVSARECVYNTYYQELIWAYKLYKTLNIEIKKYMDKYDKGILANNRWSFISYILKLVNGFSGKMLEIDYSDFQEQDQIIENIRQYTDAFVDVTKSSYPNGYKSEESKSKDFWDKIQQQQLPHLLNQIVGKKEKNDTNISRMEFVEFLRDMSFQYDEMLDEFEAEVDSIALSNVKIHVDENTFDISALLFDVFYNLNEDDSNNEKYNKYVLDVMNYFDSQLGVVPEIVDFEGCPDPTVELVYPGNKFDKSFVNKFISTMSAIDYMKI